MRLPLSTVTLKLGWPHDMNLPTTLRPVFWTVPVWAKWLTGTIFAIFVIAPAGAWFIQVATDKGWYRNAGGQFDNFVAAVSAIVLSIPFVMVASVIVGALGALWLRAAFLSPRTPTGDASAPKPDDAAVEFTFAGGGFGQSPFRHAGEETRRLNPNSTAEIRISIEELRVRVKARKLIRNARLRIEVSDHFSTHEWRPEVDFTGDVNPGEATLLTISRRPLSGKNDEICTILPDGPAFPVKVGAILTFKVYVHHLAGIESAEFKLRLTNWTRPASDVFAILGPITEECLSRPASRGMFVGPSHHLPTIHD